MHLKNLNLIIMLVAGIIVGIVSIVLSYTIERLMYTLLVVLLVFYIIGSIIQLLINGIFERSDQRKWDEEIAELDETAKELALEGEETEKQQE